MGFVHHDLVCEACELQIAKLEVAERLLLAWIDVLAQLLKVFFAQELSDFLERHLVYVGQVLFASAAFLFLWLILTKELA